MIIIGIIIGLLIAILIVNIEVALEIKKTSLVREVTKRTKTAHSPSGELIEPDTTDEFIDTKILNG